MTNTILEDKRPIKGIYWDDEHGTQYESDSFQTIEAYGEPGLHCCLPWFRVIKNGVVIARIPAQKVTVI